jgi:hypothetical protein
MQRPPDNLPNSCRLLQMIHPFENWAGTTEEAIRTRLRQAAAAGIGGVVTNVRFENYLRDERRGRHCSSAQESLMRKGSGSGSMTRKDTPAEQQEGWSWNRLPAPRPRDSFVWWTLQETFTTM